MSSHLSFDWAENGGSWELLDKAFEQAIQKSAAALPPGYAPPPDGGIMSKIPGMANMPGWGSGALIGAGVGAIGGALTDKKKRLRGALHGALLGGGVGAAAGHLANPTPAGNNEPPPIDQAEAPPPLTPEQKRFDVSPQARKVEGFIGDTYDKTKELLGTGVDGLIATAKSPIAWGVGGVMGGRALHRSGSKPVNVLGDPGGGTPNAMPDHSTTLKQLGTHNQLLDDAVKMHATSQPGNASTALVPPGKAGAPTPLTVSSQESHQNLINFNNPNPQTGLVNVQINGKRYQMTQQALNEHYRKAIQAAAGHSNLPTSTGLKRINALKRYGGNTISLAGGALALQGAGNAIRDLSGGRGTTLSKLPTNIAPNVASVKHILEMAKGATVPKEELQAWLQRAAVENPQWTPKWIQYTTDLLGQ
jgi:hypothetical protein